MNAVGVSYVGISSGPSTEYLGEYIVVLYEEHCAG